MLIGSDLSTPKQKDFECDLDFMQQFSTKMYLQSSCLWVGVLFSDDNMPYNDELATLLSCTVFTDITQANELEKEINKFRNEKQHIAYDNNKNHYYRRWVATIDGDNQYGHPVKYTKDGLHVVGIDYNTKVKLTSWEKFILTKMDLSVSHTKDNYEAISSELKNLVYNFHEFETTAWTSDTSEEEIKFFTKTPNSYTPQYDNSSTIVPENSIPQEVSILRV